MPRAFALGLLLATVSSAQSGLTGRVLDPQGQPVSQARVRLATLAESVTGADGVYCLDSVAPGRYRLTVDVAGFSPDSRELSVSAGILQVLDLSLTVAGRSDRIVVV